MKKRAYIVILTIATTFLTSCNTTATPQVSHESESDNSSIISEEDRIYMTTLSNLNIGIDVLGVDFENIPDFNDEKYKNCELFGYTGDFDYNTTVGGKWNEKIDIISWTSNNISSSEEQEDCINNIINFYDEDYEITNFRGYVSVYLWENIGTFQSIMCDKLDDNNIYIEWISYDGVIQQEQPLAIGMTADKVKSGSWGEPLDINKTTTKYGVEEQWVYSGGRYVYFKDGIVTAIQE